LQQTLVVKDVVLLDDAVPIEQKRDHGVNFIVGERSRFIGGHSAVDIVPRDRRIRVVACSGLFRIFIRAAMRVAGTAQHQTLGCPPSPFRPWHTAHRFAKTSAPSLAVPRPAGSSFPSGPTMKSKPRISSWLRGVPRL